MFYGRCIAEVTLAMPEVDSASTEEIVRAWLAYQAWSESIPERRNLSEAEWEADHALREEHGWWALEAVWEMEMYDPERLWQAILMMVQLATDDALGDIAAGPLEDLLSHHARLFVDRVEEKANTDPRFRLCLGGVWGWSRIPSDLWPRLQSVGLWPDAK